MPRLESKELIRRSGERILIYFAADGRSACPVCGYMLNCEPAWDYYWSGDAQGNIVGGPSVGPSHNICPCCNTQYGFDDVIDNDDHCITAQAQKWASLRNEWLVKVGRSPEIIEQLQNIEITI